MVMPKSHPDWQLDPLEGAWWLTAFFAVYLWLTDPYYRSAWR